MAVYSPLSSLFAFSTAKYNIYFKLFESIRKLIMYAEAKKVGSQVHRRATFLKN